MDSGEKVSSRSPEQSPGEAQPTSILRAEASSSQIEGGASGVKPSTTHGENGAESNNTTEENVKQRNLGSKLDIPKTSKEFHGLFPSEHIPGSVVRCQDDHPSH